MKRKTNLFYTDGPDSKFITFSNYTECLTGNFLSLETRLFPDKFLCLKITGLNNNTKKEFIQYLAAYYENKMAMLRDNNIRNSVNVESNILPLSYLLEAIVYVCRYENNEWVYDHNKLNNYKNNNVISDNLYSYSSIRNLITYVGEITEQDYNGTYTDTICTIDLNTYNEGEILLHRNSSFESEEKMTVTNTDIKFEKLYGWENDNLLNSEYNNVEAIYDDNKTYVYNSILSRIKLNKISLNSNENKILEFNIIIPLFNLLNKNISHESLNDFISENEIYKYINLESTGTNYIYDVPLGIWINADENEDTYVQLKKDITMNMYPSWSLLISSQFKPFPYSNELVEDNYSKSSIMHAHATYAEILSKMSNIIDMFNNMNNSILELNDRVLRIENSMKNIATDDSIANVNQKLLDTEQNVKDDINNLKQNIYGYINNITWANGHE